MKFVPLTSSRARRLGNTLKATALYPSSKAMSEGKRQACVIIDQQGVARLHAKYSQIDRRDLSFIFLELKHSDPHRTSDLGGVVGACIIDDNDAIRGEHVEEVLDRLPNHVGAVVTRDNRGHVIRRRGKIPDAGASVNLDQDLQTVHGEKKGHHEEQNKQLVRKERVA
jgi:hypothetical protein